MAPLEYIDDPSNLFKDMVKFHSKHFLPGIAVIEKIIAKPHLRELVSKEDCLKIITGKVELKSPI